MTQYKVYAVNEPEIKPNDDGSLSKLEILNLKLLNKAAARKTSTSKLKDFSRRTKELINSIPNDVVEGTSRS